MAREVHVVAKKLFIGEKKRLLFPVTTADNVTPFDATGVPLEFSVRKEDKSSTTLFPIKTVGNGIAIIGVFDDDPAINTQQVEVTIEAVDTDPLKPGTYRHALKATELETVLAFGNFTLTGSASR
jgi:hypothetical protein